MFCLIMCLPLPAQDRGDARGILFDAAGITASDINAATSRDRLSLFDIYALSVAYTERLAIEGEYSAQAGARHDSAFGAFLPQLSLRASKTFPEPGKSDSFQPKTSVSLYARQNILTGLDEYANYRGTSEEMRMRQYLLRHEAGRLLYDVGFAYVNALRVDRSLTNTQKNLDNYNMIASELERRVALGRTRKSDLLRVRSQVYGMTAKIESLGNDRARAYNALRTIAGLDKPPVLYSGAQLPGPDYLSFEPASFLGSRYDVRSAECGVRVAEYGLLSARGAHLPSVYLEGAYRLYQKDMAGRDYYAGLSATLPLFSGGMTQASVREAESKKRQAGLELSAMKRQAVREIEDAMADYNGTSRELESCRRSLEMATAAYNAVLSDYRLSLVSTLDMLDSLTTLQDARDAFDSAELDHAMSRIALGVATGEFAGESLSVLRTVPETGGDSR